jgi:hypothetical protein
MENYKRGSRRNGEDESVFGDAFGFADLGSGAVVRGSVVASVAAAGAFAFGASSGPLRPQPETTNDVARMRERYPMRLITLCSALMWRATAALRV